MAPIELRFTVACSPYRWHIYGQREDATEVDIRFVASGDATTVTIVHRGWERLGDRGEELRRRNRHGWDGLLPHYLRACPDLP
jgi:uncharacterized protein YndB with AHSA1/START domain